MRQATIHIGDAGEVLAKMPDESVHCVVTSPPYWGLRDYGVEGQLGLEESFDEYLAKLVDVFGEVRRVLRKDGTCWVNMGDGYAQAKSGSDGSSRSTLVGTTTTQEQTRLANNRDRVPADLKPKDLIGQPWRLAFALQADGWVLRSDVVWAKPNPMPESVTDRPTKSHEFMFMLAKAKWTGPEPGRFSQISDEEARWLALFVDTEGCIVIKRNRHDERADIYAPQVSIGNTHRGILERVAAIVGHGNVLERKGKNAPMFYWQVANNVARDFLHCIYPFLIIKQRQARIGIHVDSLTYWRGGQKPERKQRTPKEDAVLVTMWERCKALNHFGDPDLSDVPCPKFGKWTSQPYFYDADAVREKSTGKPPGNTKPDPAFAADPVRHRTRAMLGQAGATKARNARTVWTIPTQPYPDAHFATFPMELPARCIRAGTSEKGCCPKCGGSWKRVVEHNAATRISHIEPNRAAKAATDHGSPGIPCGRQMDATRETTGWRPTCECFGRFEVVDRERESYDDPDEPAQKVRVYVPGGYQPKPIPCTVLDPFAGAGTTGLAALRLDRRFVGIELNPEYAEMARRRIRDDAPLLNRVEVPC